MPVFDRLDAVARNRPAPNVPARRRRSRRLPRYPTFILWLRRASLASDTPMFGAPDTG